MSGGVLVDFGGNGAMGVIFSSSRSGFWVVGGGLCFSLVVAVAGLSGGWRLTCVSLF